ncbi:MAG: hypothetical protein Phog2KO_35600 [Phototrophicaceae bacterium]
MEKTFKNSLMVLGAMFMISAICFGIGVATPDESFINNAALGLLVTLICSSPLVILFSIISGVRLLIDKFTGNSQKKKRVYEDFAYDDEADANLDDIMAQLSPQQQAYLEERLQSQRLGVGDDGELMSINDLLDNYEEKEKQM